MYFILRKERRVERRLRLHSSAVQSSPQLFVVPLSNLWLCSAVIEVQCSKVHCVIGRDWWRERERGGRREGLWVDFNVSALIVLRLRWLQCHLDWPKFYLDFNASALVSLSYSICSNLWPILSWAGLDGFDFDVLPETVVALEWPVVEWGSRL